MPSVRLTIIVRIDQAASLGRLEHLGETRRTPIGTDVSVLLTAADGPPPRNSSVTSGHWRFRLKPLRQSETPTTWPPATATRLEGGTHRWENRRTSALEQENEEEMEDPHRTAYHEAGLLTG